MRTTVTIEDALAKELKEIAQRSGRSFKQVVNDALRAGVRDEHLADASRPYRLMPQSMGVVDSRLDLDKALSLADSLEDRELAGKLMPRK
ncbi:MAG: ribbon-helix-helix protein, CopG family [Bryobacterales bacterium]|nr:ribbon-helix-helix protein, CopG family [Bryobacterales bacterium]